MKKLLSALLAALMLLTLASAIAEETPATVTITSLDASGAAVELEVPYDPQRIAILDMAALDILMSLGLGDRVVGSASTSLSYLQDVVSREGVANLGTIKEADLEAVMACEPDVIFIGGRLSGSYDALSEIAPGKTAIVGLVTSGSFNVLGSDGRCSIISVEIGFENLGDSGVTSTHGNESSFELIVELDPDYLFVLDRDAAIATEGAQLAQEIVENELVMGTDVYANGNIVYLANPAVWYTAEGGITALDIMLSDLESELLA